MFISMHIGKNHVIIAILVLLGFYFARYVVHVLMFYHFIICSACEYKITTFIKFDFRIQNILYARFILFYLPDSLSEAILDVRGRKQ